MRNPKQKPIIKAKNQTLMPVNEIEIWRSETAKLGIANHGFDKVNERMREMAEAGAANP